MFWHVVVPSVVQAESLHVVIPVGLQSVLFVIDRAFFVVVVVVVTVTVIASRCFSSHLVSVIAYCRYS